jgi:hypothetical protein
MGVDGSTVLLILGLSFQVPVQAIAIPQDLLRRPDRGIGRLVDPERSTDLVDDVLVRGCHAPPDPLLSGTGRALPVRVDVPAAQRRARPGMAEPFLQRADNLAALRLDAPSGP